MKSALLIIDVQRALCAGEWAAFDIDNVVARINTVSAQARAVGVPVVLIQHEEADGPMQFDTEGWQLADSLVTHAADLRLRKMACDSFHQTDLQAHLQALGVTDLMVCGLQSEFCVDATVRRALALGYPVTLVADGHSTLDNGVLAAAQISAHHNATLGNMQSFGPRVAVVPAAAMHFAA